MHVYTYIWEARSRCIEFWLKILRMGDNRLIRSVMLEAMEMRGKVKWLRDLEQSLGELGWKGVSVEDMRGLSSVEIRQMLRDSAWRMVREVWDAEIQERSKFGVVKGLLECGVPVTMCGCRKQEDTEDAGQIERWNGRIEGGDRQVEWAEEGRKKRESVSSVPWGKLRMRNTSY